MRRAAAVLLCTALIGASPRPARAQDASAFAQERFARGVERYNAGDLAAALDDFRASLALYGSPNTRFYLARSLRELHRLPEAVPQFERAVEEANERAQTDPRYALTRDAARDELRVAERAIGRLTLTVPGAPDGTRIDVAGLAVPTAALGAAIPVTPGAVRVAVDAPGYAHVERTVVVAPEQRVELAIALRAPTPTPQPFARRAGVGASRAAHRPVEPFAAAGVGAAALTGVAAGSWGLFALLANNAWTGLGPPCPACDPSEWPRIDAGRADQVAANVSLGVAIGAGALGTLFLVVGALRSQHGRPVAP